METRQTDRGRDVPLLIDPEEFRSIGYECIDMITGLLSDIGRRPVTAGDGHPVDLRQEGGDHVDAFVADGSEFLRVDQERDDPPPFTLAKFHVGAR